MTMKSNFKNDDKKKEDLFGLLSMYKSNNTYVKVLISESEDSIVLFITDNPKNWSNVSEEKFKSYRTMKRLEIGSPKLFIKYISPVQLVKILGPKLNINIPENKINIIDHLSTDSYYILDSPLKYRGKLIDGILKLINLNPHKKFEIIEKYLSLSQE